MNAARAAVPAVNYALGAAGVAAAAAIVIGFLGKGQATLVILGAILGATLVAMLLLVAFAQLVNSKSDATVRAGVALLWGGTVCLFAFLLFMVTAVAFGWPPGWTRVLGLAVDAPTPPGASVAVDPTPAKPHVAVEPAATGTVQSPAPSAIQPPAPMPAGLTVLTADQMAQFVTALTRPFGDRSKEDHAWISQLERQYQASDRQIAGFLIAVGQAPGTPEQNADRLSALAAQFKLMNGLAASLERSVAATGSERAQAEQQRAKDALAAGDVRTAGRALSGVVSTLVWNWGAPGQRIVFVCWEAAAESFAKEKELVRTAIAASWQAASALRFHGWVTCHEHNLGIRIRIADEAPHTKGIGRELSGLKDGMVLNFAFKQWAAARCGEPQAQRELCIRAFAVHEFGHALGFVREDSKPDAPAECRAMAGGFPRGPTGAIAGPYDPYSVMNHCNPVFLNNGVLSDQDKRAVGVLYGAPG
ncbi:MAG: hypothetical protein K2Z80_37325 [Xanthobacteraceae bacterium]|nr:hypothetical protein [Xanthobacteraceae bacterium]